MKLNSEIKRSPFFYVGDKFKLIGKIKGYFPDDINTFIEPFLGGGSVFLNVEAKKYLLNDLNFNIIALHELLIKQADNESKFLQKIRRTAENYNLSRSALEDIVPISLKKQWPKTYYAEYNREGYKKLKENYNSSKKKDALVLYLLLIYGFNRILRFNQEGSFNVPVGNVDFNRNALDALENYLLITKKKKIELFSQSFEEFIGKMNFRKNDFVYMDPPYLIASSEYNKSWNDMQEEKLLNILDELTRKNVKFALSNITTYNDKKNERLITWMKKYRVYRIESNYISYHDNTKKKIDEVLVVNY